jgi:PPOX class probable F420-dependent enzyme
VGGHGCLGMDIETALDFARPLRNGVLTTIKRDGRPQLSNITYGVSDDGVVRISITADRAKYVNLRRDPRASLHVARPDFWAYVVLEGDAELAPVSAATDDATVEELVDLYRSLAGEHKDWDEYRAAMVRDHRTVVRLRPTHAYGMLPS